RSSGTCVIAVAKFWRVACAGQSRKVPAKISPGGLSAVEIIQNMGNTTIRQEAARSRWTPRPLAAIVDPPLGEPELDGGEEQEDEEDQRGRRRRVADAEVLEAQLVDEVAEVVAGLVGSPLGQDLRGDEEVLRAQDEGGEEDEQRGGGEQRQRHVPEDLALRG